MFTQRHFVWLARFAAAAALTPSQTRFLADELARTAPRFKRAVFLDAVEKFRVPDVRHADQAFVQSLRETARHD